MSKITKIPRAISFPFRWYVQKGTFVKLLLGVGLIGGGYFLYNDFTATSSIPQYQTAQVEKGTIISTVSESGNVSASNLVSISSPTDGVIEDVYVKNGDVVSLGDNLFKVKSTATPQQQASAYANYLSAQNNLNAAQAKINSLQGALFKANQAFVTDAGTPNPDTADPKYIQERAAWLQSEADYKNQALVITQAQVALNSSWLVYQVTRDSIVTAPIAGAVANFSAVIGGNVSAGTTTTTSSTSSSSTSSSGASTVLVLGDFSHLTIKAQVSEVDIPNIHPGQKATITLDAFSDKTFVGVVDSIDAIGTSTSGVVTYNVYISFVAPPENIHPGMSASAVIQLAKRNDVLMVSSAAVQSSSGGSTVQVLKNGKVTTVDVTTGLTSDTNTEIISGLSEGDVVVTGQTNTTGTASTGTTISPFGNTRGGVGGAGGFGGAGGGQRR